MPTAGSHLNILNIQVMANDQIDIDKAAGTYDENVAAYNKHYFIFGEHQVEPFNYTPHLVESLKAATPIADTYRIGFNDNSFDAQGNLDPQYEAFIHDVVENDVNLLFTFAGYGGGYLGKEGDKSSTEIETALSGEYLDKLQSGWNQFGNWLDKNPEVKANVVGLELLNEPASYEHAANMAAEEGNPNLAHYTDLYATHMAETGQIVQSFYDGDIYVDAWGWAGDLKPLATENNQGISAIEKLENAFGNDLVWSLHQYPEWAGLDGADREERIDWWEDQIAIAGDAPIVLTETNAKGAGANDYENDDNSEFQHSRIFDWLAEKDIGIGWFPGENTGASGLVYVKGSGDIEIRHQDSYASAINGFTADSDYAGTAKLELIDAKLRNEKTASDYDETDRFDPVSKIGLGFGGKTNDVIKGSEEANNFLYGQNGNDRLEGSVNDDFLYGQQGNDTLTGTGKISVLDGGPGNDVLNFRSGENLATGGTGNDTFRAEGAEDIIISDFNAQTDMLSVGDLFKDLDQLKAGISVIPGETDDHPGDLVIDAPDGTTITLLRGGQLADKPENWVEEFLVEPSSELSADDIPKAPADLDSDYSEPPEEDIQSDDGGGGAGAALAGLGLAGALMMALAGGGGMF